MAEVGEGVEREDGDGRRCRRLGVSEATDGESSKSVLRWQQEFFEDGDVVRTPGRISRWVRRKGGGGEEAVARRQRSFKERCFRSAS